MQKEVVIIGGGIIGLSCAYYLIQEGHQVTVIDKGDINSGASFVNAGYVSPSHFIPLSAPGIITQGIKWMFNSSSPFYVKPRLDSDFLKWAWAFKKSATNAHVEKSIPVLKESLILSRNLFQEIKNSNEFDFQFERKGLLIAYQTEKAGEEEWNVGKRGIEEGLKVKNLSPSEVKKMEPNVDFNIKGAVFFEDDAHMTPEEYMHKMYAYLMTKGVTFYTNEEVVDLQVSNQKITEITTNDRTIKADEVVLAAGSWTPLLAEKLGINLLVQAGKGYRINVARETGITIPTILSEAKVAITPMNGFTRFAGTMEIAGINHKINKVRVKAIAAASSSFYKGLKFSNEEIKDATSGLRPCSPDGIPFIGKSSNCNNLTFATGHAMMGWGLGPITGKMVSEIISDKKTSLNLNAFHPDRKF